MLLLILICLLPTTGLVLGLIQGADDKDKNVQKSISDALCKVGEKHVDMVISSCLNYLVTNLKVI